MSQIFGFLPILAVEYVTNFDASREALCLFIAGLLLCVRCDVTCTALAHRPALWESSLKQWSCHSYRAIIL